MKSKTFCLAIFIQLTSFSSFANNEVSFPQSMYSENGCSEVYFQKARRVNKTVGFTLGGLGLISSAVMPLAPIFFIGGLGAAGETAYTYLEEKEDPTIKDKAPRIRYPIARQYFDIVNTLELNKIIEANKDQDVATYIKLYMESIVLAAKEGDQYKNCTTQAKAKGISKSELKGVEKDITEYLMSLDEENSSRNEIENAKKEFAQCLLDIKSKDKDAYPIADMLLFRAELAKTNLMNWRLQSAIRFYEYVQKKAKDQNQGLDIETYFNMIQRLDTEKNICSNAKRPLNRKNLANEILSLLK